MLLTRIENYMRLTKMSPSRFGREVLGDPCFVTALRLGRDPRSRTTARVIAWIDAREQELAQ